MMLKKNIYTLSKGYVSWSITSDICYDKEPLCVSDDWNLINNYAIKLCNDILKTGYDEWLSSIYTFKKEDLIYWQGFGYHSVGFSLNERIIFRISKETVQTLEKSDLKGETNAW